MSSSADAAYLIYLKIYDKRYSHTQQIIIKDNKDVKFIKLKTTISDVCKIIYNFNYNNYDKYIYFHKLFKILYILQSEEYDIQQFPDRIFVQSLSDVSMLSAMQLSLFTVDGKLAVQSLTGQNLLSTQSLPFGLYFLSYEVAHTTEITEKIYHVQYDLI